MFLRDALLIAPDGIYRAVRTTYDADGNATLVEQGTVADQSDGSWNGFSSQQKAGYTYDTLGRKIQGRSIGSDGATYSVVEYSYDSKGRPDCTALRMGSATGPACSVENSGDRISEMSYDNDDRTTTVVQGVGVAPVAVQSQYYTANGRTQSVMDGRGVNDRTSYQYDGFDRLSTVSWPTPRTGASTVGLNKSVSYDNFNRPVSVTQNGQVVSYTYDALGRVSSESGPLGTVSYQYDADGRRTSMTWPDGVKANYNYDQTGALIWVSVNGTNVVGYGYDSAGRRSYAIGNNNIATNYSYDPVLNATLMSGSRLTGSYQLIGTNPRDYSVAVTTGPDLTGNVNVSGHIQFNLPALYQLNCGQ